MAMTIVRVTSGGIPVTESATGYPYYEADNGFGIPVTFGSTGIPLGRAGIPGTPVSVPAGFTYTPPFTVYRQGADSASTFLTNYTYESKRPTPTATVWVSSAVGNNNNDGASQASPIRSITLAILMANALGGTVLIKVDETSSYLLSASQARSGQPSLNATYVDAWNVGSVNAPTCSIIIEPWGTGYINNVYDRAAVTWSATSDPNIYVATWTGSTPPCYILPDPAFTDLKGYPIGMNPVTTVADVANPWPELNAAWTVADTAAGGSGPSKYTFRGAVFHDTSANKKTFIRRGDNSAPGTAIKLYSAGIFPGMSAVATATITICLKNFRSWGGDQGFKLMPNVASGFKVNLYTSGCSWLFTGNTVGNGGLYANGGGTAVAGNSGEIINLNDYARGCANDAYGTFVGYDRAELFCESWGIGASPAALTINGSTGHDLCRTVIVGSTHKDAYDRTVHYIGGTKTWVMGATVSTRRGPSGGTTSAGYAAGSSGQSSPFSTMWLDACSVVDGLNGAAQYATEAYTGATLNYANLAFTPTAGDGTGTVQTYTP